MDMKLRLATLEDARGILAVYAPYVRDTAVSFELTPPGLAEFEARMRGILGAYPYLVLEENGHTVGYAYAHRAMERAAYQWNAELSVYLAPSHQRRGLGRTLYSALLELLRLQNVLNAYGCVTLPNPGSEALHERMGFSRLAVYRQTGYKLGAWRDVVWFEKSLGAHVGAPQPLLRFDQLEPQAVTRALARAQLSMGS